MGRKTTSKKPLIIGWREVVSLPDLGLENFRAKIDTGARTTALHATHIRTFEEDGIRYVQFRPPRLGHPRPRSVTARVFDERPVRNTGGVPEVRVIIRTHLHLANRNFLIEVSLANRRNMTYPMIIGRTAIRYHSLLVDSGRSWLTRPSSPQPAARRTA